MISNKESKLIKSLQLKKFRKSEGKFIVEGAKNILELLQSEFIIIKLFVTSDFIESYPSELNGLSINMTEVTEKELSKTGAFVNNNAGLAIVEIPKPQSMDFSKSILAFDRVKDPGNLGTIIRIADWYGFEQIACSLDSVDCFNPKVVSATMGSFSRVKVTYCSLEEIIEQSPSSYGATLNGDEIYKIEFKAPALILFGNESNGISPQLIAKLDREVKIPSFGKAESLNVGVSTAVFCDNFRRILKS